MPKLARTLERIRDDPEGFYNGELAKDIVQDIQDGGGIFTLDDLKNYKVKFMQASNEWDPRELLMVLYTSSGEWGGFEFYLKHFERWVFFKSCFRVFFIEFGCF